MDGWTDGATGRSPGTTRAGTGSGGDCLPRLSPAGPPALCAAGKALVGPPGLGTGGVCAVKGSRRWLFPSAAFARACAGSEPGWKLCPHEQRGSGEGRETEGPRGRGS